MLVHEEKSKLAGLTLKIKHDVYHPQFDISGMEIEIEDYFDRLLKKSWHEASKSNPAAYIYASRIGSNDLPTDDEVLYGKVFNRGVLIHISELVLD